jgi:ketosteroid isomerase-like protein
MGTSSHDQRPTIESFEFYQEGFAMNFGQNAPRNELTRRDLMIKLGAGVLAMGVTSACAPIPAIVSTQSTRSGDFSMHTVSGRTATSQTESVSAEESFREFLARFEEGTSRFINGDPTLWKANASQRDDVTIMGAWGAAEVGWDEAGARYDWAAARFLESGAKVNVEYLASGVSGDFAYTIANEHSEALIVGQDKLAPMALRVTHLFRLEDGEWKLIHRHADPLMEKTAPDTVLQQ